MFDERASWFASIPFGLLLTACASQPPAATPSSSTAVVAPAAAAGSAETTEEIRARAKIVTAVTALPSDDDVICTRERGLTGTHMEREVCRTRAQRRQQRMDSQDWARSGGRRGGVTVVPTVR